MATMWWGMPSVSSGVGYDTLGESFILIAGVAGCLVILRKSKAHGEEGDHE